MNKAAEGRKDGRASMEESEKQLENLVRELKENKNKTFYFYFSGLKELCPRNKGIFQITVCSKNMNFKDGQLYSVYA